MYNPDALICLRSLPNTIVLHCNFITQTSYWYTHIQLFVKRDCIHCVWISACGSSVGSSFLKSDTFFMLLAIWYKTVRQKARMAEPSGHNYVTSKTSSAVLRPSILQDAFQIIIWNNKVSYQSIVFFTPRASTTHIFAESKVMSLT